ncbi:MAG: CbbQ/NirQ/NorQ/GpvN family protein [Deltaproteobacteria bacterium]|nr:CbbQ/NirQ/NorQ/GpvN family protein [Deltaproteobacteria bacterium]
MIDTLPFYCASGHEQQSFRAAHESHLPLMLTGPTGCGKTRLVEHMAAALDQPLVTVTCHDDLSSADLVGRFLVRGGDVEWIDGPLTSAVRRGAICYLDEIVEARRDTLAVLHSLTDHRRTLYLDRNSETLQAPAKFMLVCSYNPSSRSALKELKPSFRQRFVTVDLDYLAADEEASVVSAETGASQELARSLVELGNALRLATDGGVYEAPSTRSLVIAAKLMASGLDKREAVGAAVLAPLVSGGPMDDGLREILEAAISAETS